MTKKSLIIILVLNRAVCADFRFGEFRHPRESGEKQSSKFFKELTAEEQSDSKKVRFESRR